MNLVAFVTSQSIERTARRALCLLVCALCVATMPPLLTAQDEIDPVTSARESLREAHDLPWYNAESDDIRALPPPTRKDPPPRPTQGTEIDPGDGQITVRAAPLGLGTILLVLGVTAIGALFIVIVAFLINALLGGSKTAIGSSAQARSVQSQADRIEDLPVPLKRAQSDLLGEARRQYERGDYNEAIIYLYSYLLVELDKASRIRLVRGKTNRQYLRELRDAPELASLVGETMIAFEDVYFGGHDLSRERFESCWRQVDKFQSHVELAVA